MGKKSGKELENAIKSLSDELEGESSKPSLLRKISKDIGKVAKNAGLSPKKKK
eukprot:CAMPEP_0177637146 /NCGR_PEP_ID=MMETSP0447-20121125/4817_1 /TAXON_ID=0 /ORGANISM="Stygamoeba regulata, Strain BSH-02190019" /LENGTH=52 /DNA_ID=CAMNT_0019139057 /DNA_START=42 /DNA_END=200 /DNA_ORIENTATION=+